MYSIGEFSALIGKTRKTLRTWEREGKLIPAYRTIGKHRMYSEDQLNQILNIIDEEKINVGYARVSSKKQSDDLNRQVELLEKYLASKNKSYKIITDIGSGINYNKNGLLELLKLINDKKITTIVILYKDRLIRFGYELIEHYCKLNNTTIEIMNVDESKTSEEELIDDILNIIKSFSHNSRNTINKKLIEQLNGRNS